MDMHGHAAWIYSMDMQQGHAAWTSMHMQAHAVCTLMDMRQAAYMQLGQAEWTRHSTTRRN